MVKETPSNNTVFKNYSAMKETQVTNTVLTTNGKQDFTMNVLNSVKSDDSVEISEKSEFQKYMSKSRPLILKRKEILRQRNEQLQQVLDD